MHSKHQLADLIQLYLQHLETKQASTAHRAKIAWHLKPLRDRFANRSFRIGAELIDDAAEVSVLLPYVTLSVG